ncbi:hypothetical protein HERIO_594 [Hepatospora eriocheir]|uniref:Uncharacterized protein n=1 Tax=Hepatospora eriocheir TaxID=1081669 RepID=A0A1X0QCK8_9MICR|nr:hypothetical protein HERIO_594 [Hepatospora eriocheir]
MEKTSLIILYRSKVSLLSVFVSLTLFSEYLLSLSSISISFIIKGVYLKIFSKNILKLIKETCN